MCSPRTPGLGSLCGGGGDGDRGSRIFKRQDLVGDDQVTVGTTFGKD